MDYIECTKEMKSHAELMGYSSHFEVTESGFVSTQVIFKSASLHELLDQVNVLEVLVVLV